MFAVPEDFRSGPFARSTALEEGISARVLEGVQFVRLHEGVYVHRDHPLTLADRIAAARLALPDEARTTGITRLQELGLDFGPPSPLHFVVARDLHLTIPGIFLHRTVSMPSADDDGVSVEAAFVAYCAEGRLVDVIKVGSMLLHLERLDPAALQALLVDQPWRRGVVEARWVLEHLDGRCRSLPEAELLALVRFSGLPEPDVNRELRDDVGAVVTPDLWFASWRQAVEYEGVTTRRLGASTTRTSIATWSCGPWECRTSRSPRSGCASPGWRSGGSTRPTMRRATTDRSPSSVSCGPPCCGRSATSYAAVPPNHRCASHIPRPENVAGPPLVSVSPGTRQEWVRQPHPATRECGSRTAAKGAGGKDQ